MLKLFGHTTICQFDSIFFLVSREKVIKFRISNFYERLARTIADIGKRTKALALGLNNGISELRDLRSDNHSAGKSLIATRLQVATD
ncbi:hypothetical protein J6590_087114 [Homalodisca vitripennis]|nr:hypothetical protein J6590_087114 [Homalodisca vitripennis]